MGDYRPPFTVTNKILLYVSSISEKIGRITATDSLTANSLTLGQVRDVINGRFVLGEQKEIQEVKNAYAAYERLSEINPYSI